MKSDEKCNALHRSGILLHPIAIGNIRIPGGKMVGHISFIFLFVCRMAVCYLFLYKYFIIPRLFLKGKKRVVALITVLLSLSVTFFFQPTK